MKIKEYSPIWWLGKIEGWDKIKKLFLKLFKIKITYKKGRNG